MLLSRYLSLALLLLLLLLLRMSGHNQPTCAPLWPLAGGSDSDASTKEPSAVPVETAAPPLSPPPAAASSPAPVVSAPAAAVVPSPTESKSPSATHRCLLLFRFRLPLATLSRSTVADDDRCNQCHAHNSLKTCPRGYCSWCCKHSDEGPCTAHDRSTFQRTWHVRVRSVAVSKRFSAR